jgi:hypothetical protein
VVVLVRRGRQLVCWVQTSCMTRGDEEKGVDRGQWECISESIGMNLRPEGAQKYEIRAVMFSGVGDGK